MLLDRPQAKTRRVAQQHGGQVAQFPLRRLAYFSGPALGAILRNGPPLLRRPVIVNFVSLLVFAR